MDDGSQDSSAQIIRAYEKRDERIRFFQLVQNAGTAAACNYAIPLAQGEYLTFMDCDDVSLPERLRKQVDYLQSYPDIGAVGTHAQVVNADLQHMFYLKPPLHHAPIIMSQFTGTPFVHASIVLRRDLVLEVGGFDQSMRYSADSDLMIRLMGRTRFSNIAEYLYLYRQHAGQTTAQGGVKREQDRLLLRSRRLEKLRGEAPNETLDRLANLSAYSRLSWRERKAAKRDLKRLIDSMMAASLVSPSDKPVLIEAMNRRMEQASPRIWQMFCHWRRHHFGANNRDGNE